MEEWASGELTFHWVYNNNGFLLIYRGKLTGEDSDNDYWFNDIWTTKNILNNNNNRRVLIRSRVVLIHCNGKPFARHHYVWHVTWNAKGEVTSVWEDGFEWECL